VIGLKLSCSQPVIGSFLCSALQTSLLDPQCSPSLLRPEVCQVEGDDIAFSSHIKHSVFTPAKSLLIRAFSLGWGFLRLMKHSRTFVAPVFDFET